MSVRLHVVGNSITADTGPTKCWAKVSTGLFDRLTGLALWYQAQHDTPETPSPVANCTSFGVSSQGIADLDAGFDTQVAAFAPIDVLGIEIGVNDAHNGNTGAGFSASYASVVAKARALNPNMKFVLGTCLCSGELLAPGPEWGANPDDANILLVDNRIAAQVAAIGDNARLADWRQALLGVEIAINTPVPGAASGRGTIDGVHPQFEVQLMMADEFLDVMPPEWMPGLGS